MCFSCHDPGLIKAVAGTQFRHGHRNLHEVHLRSGGGASACGACHAVHAGNLPRLIAETVNYEGSDWAEPLGFRLAPEGGSCAPACHEPMSYRRSPPPPLIGGSP
jgi:formate-dependent nitrite reductase cytochrome c552 subunit